MALSSWPERPEILLAEGARVGTTLEYLPPKSERQLLAQGPTLIQRVAVSVSGK